MKNGCILEITFKIHISLDSSGNFNMSKRKIAFKIFRTDLNRLILYINPLAIYFSARY